MKKKIKINVTQRDIDKGCKGQRTTSCPIARAAGRNKIIKSKIIDRLAVSEAGITLDKKCAEVIYLPSIAIKFISNFDSKRAVEPFSFFVEVEV